MDRIRAWFRREAEEYTPLVEEGVDGDGTAPTPLSKASTFSWLEYAVFTLLGLSQLWAYNMVLAAGPYLNQRFAASPWIAHNWQASQLVVSGVINLSFMLLLTQMQRGASYPRRIVAALVINIASFSLLAASTKIATGISAEAYFGFILVSVAAWSLSTSLFQNGIFAYLGGFAQQARYTQGVMVGQGIAGVLPCIAQVALMLSFDKTELPPPEEGDVPAPGGAPVSSTAALAYFLTAVGISAATFFAFTYLVRRHATEKLKANVHADNAPAKTKAVPMGMLLRKLAWPAATVFITFVITIQYPIFVQTIVSVVPPERASRIQQPACFIPIAFLFWNVGDLIGRTASARPKHALRRWPRAVFVFAVGRTVFVALYQLCNIRGEGAIVNSDWFYLLVVQLLYGATNGYVGSICMMGAGDWVEPDEREAAGGFMGLCLVAGLTVGSFLGFFASGGGP